MWIETLSSLFIKGLPCQVTDCIKEISREWVYPVNFSCWVLGKESETLRQNCTVGPSEEGVYMHITVRAYATSGKSAETGHLKFTKMNNGGLFVLVVIGFKPVTTGCHIDK